MLWKLVKNFCCRGSGINAQLILLASTNYRTMVKAIQEPSPEFLKETVPRDGYFWSCLKKEASKDSKEPQEFWRGQCHAGKIFFWIFYNISNQHVKILEVISVQTERFNFMDLLPLKKIIYDPARIFSWGNVEEWEKRPEMLKETNRPSRRTAVRNRTPINLLWQSRLCIIYYGYHSQKVGEMVLAYCACCGGGDAASPTHILFAAISSCYPAKTTFWFVLLMSLNSDSPIVRQT